MVSSRVKLYLQEIQGHMMVYMPVIISTGDTRSHDGVYASNYICTLYIVYCTVSTVQ